MSELKVFKLPLKTNIFGRTIIDQSYYEKTEADKVIAELKSDYKEACDRLQTANLIKDEQLAATCHSNYKRCLAMYRYCAIKALYELDCKGNDVEWKWYSKWMHKWFKLAQKFKEANRNVARTSRSMICSK